MRYKLDELVAVGQGACIVSKINKLGFELYALIHLDADGNPATARTFFERAMAFKALHELVLKEVNDGNS